MYFSDCLLYGIITSSFELLELISIALGLNKTWLSFFFFHSLLHTNYCYALEHLELISVALSF